MYGNYNPYFSQQMNIERINNQIKELENLRGQYQNIQQPMNTPTTPSINQTFQLSSNNNGINYAKDIDDVKKELVLNNTLFINREYTLLWHKNTGGEIKSYRLEEIIELDEKDKKIADLMSKIELLEKEVNNANVISNANATITSEEPTNVSNNKSSKK